MGTKRLNELKAIASVRDELPKSLVRGAEIHGATGSSGIHDWQCGDRAGRCWQPCAFIECSPNEAPGEHRLMVVELKVAGCANPLGAEG